MSIILVILAVEGLLAQAVLLFAMVFVITAMRGTDGQEEKKPVLPQKRAKEVKERERTREERIAANIDAYNGTPDGQEVIEE